MPARGRPGGAFPGALAALVRIGSLIGRRRRLSKGSLRQSRAVGGPLAALIALAFVLFCVAPAIPLLRLGADAADALQRLTSIEHALGSGPATLANTASLSDLENQVDAIQSDLRELDGAANLALAPLAAVSPRVAALQRLARVGMDLASAGADGLRIARLLVLPLERGALSADAAAAGVTSADLQQAAMLLRAAEAQVNAAIATYQAINPADLPAMLQPTGRYGKLLARLPEARQFFGLLDGALAAAPAVLGVGQPAFYLVAAMDRGELRPIGGLMGNYGILALHGGRQMSQYPLALHNTYNLDNAYYLNPMLNSDPNPDDTPGCLSSGPQAPPLYWWWPIRDFSCQYGWGLRDAGLSPDFPTNAQMDIAIAQDAGAVPGGAPLQGMIAFTPAPIEGILNVTGPIAVPGFNTTVSAGSLERQIHDYQLLGNTPAGQDRKEFTHQLSIALLARVRGLHGSQLKSVVTVIARALRDKEIEVYFSDPRAEALLRHFGLAGAIATGNGDGFYVVDTNDGGNKANLYVTEQQTDVVTLLPDGSALHHLRIAVTYDKIGPVFEGSTGFEDYSDVQRTYLPANAEVLGYAGFTPPVLVPNQCGTGGYASLITNCDRSQALITPVTTSDVPGRGMVMGPVLATCGGVSDVSAYDPAADLAACRSDPVPQTVNIYLTWLTPGAVPLDARGHGTYRELVQKQPGSVATLSVYVINATSGEAGPAVGGLALGLTDPSSAPATRDAAFAALVAGATRIYQGPLAADTVVSYHV